MSKLAYRRSTPNGLLPLNLSSTSSSLTTSVSNPLVSTFSSSSSSLPSFEVLTKVNSNPIDKASTQTSPRYIRRTSSASLLSNNFGPIPYNRTPSITALPDSPSWVSRSRKSSAESSRHHHPTNAHANPFVARQEGRRRDSESNVTSSSSLLMDRRFSANGLVGIKLGNGIDESNQDESQDIEELDSSWTSNNTTLTSTPSPINIIRGPKGSPVEAQISQKKLLSDQMVPFQYSASLGPVRVAPSKTSNRLYPPSTSRTREARRPRSAEAEMGIHREVKSSKSFREMEKDEALAEAVRRIVCVSASNSQERLEKVEPVLKSTSKSKSEKRTSVSSIALEFPDVPVRAPVERPGSSRSHRRPRTQEDRGQVKMTELKRKTSLSSPSVYKSLDQSLSVGKFSTAPSTPFSNVKPSTPTSSTTSQVYSTPQMVEEEVLETISSAASTGPPSAWRKSVQTLSSKRPVSVDLQTEIMARPSFDDLRAVGQVSGTKLDPPIQLVEKSFISSKRASINNIRSRVQSATSCPTSPLESIANFNAKKMNQRFSYSLSNSLEDELNSKKSQEFEQEQSCIHGEVDRSSTINFSRPISQGIEMENQVQAMLQKTPTQSSRREWQADNRNFTKFSDYNERNEDNNDSPSSLTSTLDTSYFDDIISSSTNTNSPLTSPEIEARSLPKSSMTVTRQHSNSTSTSSTADTASSSEGLLDVNRNGSGYSTSNSKAIGSMMGEKSSKKTSRKLGLNMMFKKVFGNSTSNKPAKSLAFKCSPTSSVVEEEEEDKLSRNRSRGGIPRLDTRISNDVVFPIMRETGQAVNNHFQRETLSDLPFDPFSSSRARESSSYESFQKSHLENPIRGLIRRSSSFTLSGGKRVLEARG